MNVTLKSLPTRAMTTILLLQLCGTAFSDDLLTTQRANKASSAGPSLGESASSYVRDYLSDRRRAGSLAGSILGGALSAHPAGPVVGSLVGFFIGKQSMFNEEKTKAVTSGLLYARRDIVPQNGLATPTLSLTNTQRITFDAPDTGMANQVSMPTPAYGGLSREQLATMCAGGPNVDPRFRGLCFYASGS